MSKRAVTSAIVGVSATCAIASPRLTSRVPSAVAIQTPEWLACRAG